MRDVLEKEEKEERAEGRTGCNRKDRRISGGIRHYRIIYRYGGEGQDRQCTAYRRPGRAGGFLWFSDLSSQEIINSKGICAVLSDGMGGLTDGRKVSEYVTARALSFFEEWDIEQPAWPQMETFIKDTNREVCEAYSRDGKPGAGATLVFLAVLNDRAFWCSAGDSRLYLLRRGKLYQMNEDHDYKNQLLGRYIERDGTTLEQAFGDAQGSALASYMGCPGMTTYECSVRGLPLQNRDRFLLMSDGVYRALTEQELLKREGESPQKMCEHLIGDAEAKQMPGQDNMTLLAVEYQWEEPSAPETEEREEEK